MSRPLADDFEAAKAKLFKEELNGTNLYQHLTKTVLKLVKDSKEQKPGPLTNLEDICTALKQTTFIHKLDGVPKEDVKPKAAIDQEKWVGSVAPLMGASSTKITWDTANLLEHAGVSIGKQESFILNKKIQELPAQNARLWGKILGTNSDYYVVEGDATAVTSDFDKYGMDRPGYNGANLKSYWVCNGPGGEFSALPHVTSEQILAAKTIKRFFTGDLAAPVNCFPVFPGNEANLLRAQIACISVACTIVPTGVFGEPEKPEDEEAEFDPNKRIIDPTDLQGLLDKAVATTEMADLAQWSYYYPGGGDLNKYGRCTEMPPTLDEDGEPIEDLEPDFKEPLQGLDGDANPKWALKLIKDSRLLSLKHQEWPGAVSVGYGEPYPKCVNFYVGYGFKRTPRGYNPPRAPLMQEEYVMPEDADTADYNATLTEHPDELTITAIEDDE